MSPWLWQTAKSAFFAPFFVCPGRGASPWAGLRVARGRGAQRALPGGETEARGVSGLERHLGEEPRLLPTGMSPSPQHHRPSRAPGAAGRAGVASPRRSGAPGLSAQPRHLFAKLPSLCSTWEENGPYREAICSLTKPFRLSPSHPTLAAARASSRRARRGLNNPAGSAAAREPAVGRVRGSLIRLPNITALGGAGVGEGRRRRREVGFAPDPCVGGSRNDLTGGAFLPLAVGCF